MTSDKFSWKEHHNILSRYFGRDRDEKIREIIQNWKQNFPEIKNQINNEKILLIREKYLLIKAIRREKFILEEKEYHQVLPKEIVSWAEDLLNSLSKEYSCVDSYRVANIKKSSQVKRFKRNRSCCGSYEEIFAGPDGNKYILGFNHGH